MAYRRYKEDGPESIEIEPDGETFSDGRAHEPVHPWSSESTFQLSHGTNNRVQSRYPPELVLAPLRGQPVSNRGSNFDEVKHVAPQTWVKAPGQPDLVKWKPQGHTKLLSLVSNDRDLVFDESLPNRHAVFLSGLPLALRRGHGGYQRGLTGYGLGRLVPGLGSPYFISQGPEFARWKRIWPSAQYAQLLRRNPNVKQFVQGKPGREECEPKGL